MTVEDEADDPTLPHDLAAPDAEVSDETSLSAMAAAQGLTAAREGAQLRAQRTALLMAKYSRMRVAVLVDSIAEHILSSYCPLCPFDRLRDGNRGFGVARERPNALRHLREFHTDTIKLWLAGLDIAAHHNVLSPGITSVTEEEMDLIGRYRTPGQGGGGRVVGPLVPRPEKKTFKKHVSR